MTHVKVAFCDYSGEDAGLSFSDSYLSVEVVAVHEGEGVEEVADGEIVEGLGR
jgi:hypothetical protein